MQFKIVGSVRLSWIDSTGKEVYRTIEIDELVEAEYRESAINKVKADYKTKHSTTFQPTDFVWHLRLNEP